MEDFREFSKKTTTQKTDVFELAKNLAGKFDGKNTTDLVKAIYKEAEKGKRAGTLTNAEIDNFAMTLSPFLDDKQRKYLKKVVEELKKI